jgi:hypothetical protein
MGGQFHASTILTPVKQPLGPIDLKLFGDEEKRAPVYRDPKSGL